VYEHGKTILKHFVVFLFGGIAKDGYCIYFRVRTRNCLRIIYVSANYRM